MEYEKWSRAIWDLEPKVGQLRKEIWLYEPKLVRHFKITFNPCCWNKYREIEEARKQQEAFSMVEEHLTGRTTVWGEDHSVRTTVWGESHSVRTTVKGEGRSKLFSICLLIINDQIQGNVCQSFWNLWLTWECQITLWGENHFPFFTLWTFGTTPCSF